MQGKAIQAAVCVSSSLAVIHRYVFKAESVLGRMCATNSFLAPGLEPLRTGRRGQTASPELYRLALPG